MRADVVCRGHFCGQRSTHRGLEPERHESFTVTAGANGLTRRAFSSNQIRRGAGSGVGVVPLVLEKWASPRVEEGTDTAVFNDRGKLRQVACSSEAVVIRPASHCGNQSGCQRLAAAGEDRIAVGAGPGG
ncbi:unnamed protein product [Gadus morhua 'NCC']